MFSPPLPPQVLFFVVTIIIIIHYIIKIYDYIIIILYIRSLAFECCNIALVF